MATRACKSDGMLPYISEPRLCAESPGRTASYCSLSLRVVAIVCKRRIVDAFRYLGKGVGKAVENINKTISPGIAVRFVNEQYAAESLNM